MGVKDPKDIYGVFSKAFNAKDADALLSYYEDDGVVIAAPGQLAVGKAAIKEALGGFFALNATIEFVKVAEPAITGDLALLHSKWRLTPEGGESMEGASSEIMRRQSDGTWLYAIDNPWGTAVLDD